MSYRDKSGVVHWDIPDELQEDGCLTFARVYSPINSANVYMGRVKAANFGDAIEQIVRLYPHVKVRSLQYVGVVDGLPWWEFVAVEVSA